MSASCRTTSDDWRMRRPRTVMRSAAPGPAPTKYTTPADANFPKGIVPLDKKVSVSGAVKSRPRGRVRGLARYGRVGAMIAFDVPDPTLTTFRKRQQVEDRVTFPGCSPVRVRARSALNPIQRRPPFAQRAGGTAHALRTFHHREATLVRCKDPGSNTRAATASGKTATPA